jgi:hypothetical protein
MEASSSSAGSGGNAWRAFAVLVFLILLLGAAIMIIAMTDIAGTPTCDAVNSGQATLPADGQCYDGSSVQKTFSLIVGYAGGAAGVLAALVAIAFTFTGRRGRLVVALTIAAIALSGIGILIGSL